jgi:hypothetical protein
MMKRAGRRKIIARDSGKQRIDPRTIRINRRERNTWYGGNRGGHTLTKATRKSDARGKPIYTTSQGQLGSWQGWLRISSNKVMLSTPGNGVRTPIPILSWIPDYRKGSRGRTVHSL